MCDGWPAGPAPSRFYSTPIGTDAMSDLSMKTNFAFRVDIWDATGDGIVEHVAGVHDFEVAEATWLAAVKRNR
jgi:hypothetical protein